MSRWLKRLSGLLAIVGAVSVSDPSYVTAQRGSQEGAQQGEWRNYYGDSYGTKYSPLSQITKENVHDLRVVWRQPYPDRALQASNPLLRTPRTEETPLMVNGVLYMVTGLGLVAALDPATGETRWVYDPQGYKTGRHPQVPFVRRGFGYWTDGNLERLLVGTEDAYLISVDARTGKPDVGFGDRGKVDLTVGIRHAIRATNFTSRRPLIAGNVVVVGSSIQDHVLNKEEPPGYVHGFDVRTGKRLWTFHTIPTPGEFGYETWLEDSAEYTGSANVWGGGVYDPELDYIYLPTSSPTNNYYGGHRLGDNLFAESLVCVEAKTGKRVWHFQAVHHGLWDYDFPTHPILGDITVNGRRIKAVMQVSKQAFTYVFDRRTGQPVWPIEERPVPPSTVPGERTSPTQPFPTKPPAFDLQGATEDNLIDFTPELRKRALEQLQALEHGPLFTPISSMRSTVLVPGITGGANWGGAGFDPETGVLYVPSRMRPFVLKLIPVDPKQGNMRYEGDRPIGGGLDTIDGLSIFKPPYSRVTAIDLNTGEHRWMAPLGNGPRNHPLLKDLNLPPLGDENQNGVSVLVTKTLLFVSARPLGTKWDDADAVRKLLYVFDKQSGKVVRVVEMDGLAAAAPMTYLHGGKQYVVVATNGRATNELVALNLPGTPGN
jgi:quinoprotein glucose dehydrogenase